MSAKTGVTEQGIEVDAGIVEFISHLNDCGWLETMQSCSGLEADHEEKEYSGIPHVTFYGKTLAEEGAKEDRSTLLHRRPTPDDIELINAIQEAGWFHNLHFMLPNASAYPRYINHTSSTNPDPDSMYKMVLLGRLFGHGIKDTPDNEKIEKWKDLIAVLSSKFCSSKNLYPEREVPVTAPTIRRFEDSIASPSGLPKSAAKEIYDKLLEWL